MQHLVWSGDADNDQLIIYLILIMPGQFWPDVSQQPPLYIVLMLSCECVVC